MKRLEEIARFTADVDAAVAFYQKFLGQDPASWRSGETATFMLGDAKLFLHRAGGVGIPGGPRDEDHVSFAVEDVDAACEELRQAGIEVQVGPRDYYWGRSAYLRDPDGRLLELHKA